VIGQIPKEALEFERMFAQRTQPPPPEPSPSAQGTASPPTAATDPLPSFASEPPPAAETPKEPEPSDAPAAPDDETKNVPVDIYSRSEPPTIGTLGRKSSSDVRAMVSLAEATHPSVARSVTARRLRVTLVTLLVLAVLVALFVIRMPR
jgi:hypothetical protein